MQNWIDSSFTDLTFATKSAHDAQEKLVLQQVARVSRNFIQTAGSRYSRSMQQPDFPIRG